MAELVAGCALVVLALLGAGAAALRAVLDGGRVGVPASVSVVAPLAEAARLLRRRAPGRSTSRRPVVAGTALLGAAALRVLALPIAGAPLLGGSFGLLWLVVADAVWWAGATVLAERGDRGRSVLRAVALEAPLVVALATPAVAAGSLRAPDLLAAQQSLPFAAEAPVALLIALVAGGLLLPAALPARGTARPLVAAARAVQPVSAAGVAAVLLLGAGGSPSGAVLLVPVAALLAALVVAVAQRLPVLRPQRLVELSAVVLLPLALVQLGVVAVLTLLGGAA